MNKLKPNERNLVRIKKVVEAELLIQQAEHNKNNKWWNYHKFDYDVFLAGFMSGIAYFKRISQGHNLEDEESIKVVGGEQ